jgi:ferrous iron transport protein A
MNVKRRTMTLVEAPRGIPVRIQSVLGGEGIRRRLFCLGFHIEDLIQLDSAAIFRGPVLVKNVITGTTVALGRGIAQKIVVEVVDDQS